MNREKKILRYLKQGRLKKFKSYFRKHKLNYNHFKFSDGDLLIHKLCYFGCYSLIKCNYLEPDNFLEKNINNGRLPCHEIIRGAISFLRTFSTCNFDYYKLIDYVGRLCPESLNVKDRFNSTANEMKLLYYDLLKNSYEASSNSKDEDEEDNGESEWNAKLETEFNEDTYQRNYDDYFASYSDHETYNDWANRIAKEHNSKNQKQFVKANNKARKLPDPQNCTYPKISPENIEEFERKMKESKRQLQEGIAFKKQNDKTHYMKRCEEFFNFHRNNQNKCDVIMFSDVPWPFPSPNGNVTDIDTFLFSHIDKSSKDFKLLLKKCQIMWHIDRFKHRCDKYLKPSEREKILRTVNEISKYFNVLSHSLKLS